MESEAITLDIAGVFIELGVIVILLGVLARIAAVMQVPPIPFYLLAGLLFGQSGVLPLEFPQTFVQIGAEIGVILLLFMLGLEYTAPELRNSLRSGLPYGVMNLVLSFTPGVIFALALGWSALAAMLLGGVTYVSSSGIIAKTLNDLEWLGNRETPVVLSVLVLEDLTMAVLLPLMAVLLLGSELVQGMTSLGIALLTVSVVLLVALRYGERISHMIASRSDEVILLTVFGLILLVAGIAQSLQVSSAIGAFLVGIALSGSVAERARMLLSPLRDLFAATFFLFFSLQIDPATLPPVLELALILGGVTLLTKFVTGYVAAWRNGIGVRGRFRAGVMLVPRGEFSIVIAGLGISAGLDEPDLIPLATAYVLLMAVAGPVLAKVVDPTVATAQRGLRRFRSRRSRQFGDGFRG